MASKPSSDKSANRTQQAGPAPGANPFPTVFSPEAILGVWQTWMNDHVGAAATKGLQRDASPWLMSADSMPDLSQTGFAQIAEHLTKDQTLATLDRMWNANPLHDVIPVDWAEVA